MAAQSGPVSHGPGAARSSAARIAATSTAGALTAWSSLTGHPEGSADLAGLPLAGLVVADCPPHGGDLLGLHDHRVGEVPDHFAVFRVTRPWAKIGQVSQLVGDLGANHAPG